VSTADGVPVEAVGGAIIKAYSAFLGGTQYTDLSMDQAGTQIVSEIVASDGTDGLMLGQIPQFYGPDGVWEVWLSANNGPRVRAQALDTADLVSAGLDSIAAAAATLDQADADHASLGQANGIATLGSDGKLKSTQQPAPTGAWTDLVMATGYAVHGSNSVQCRLENGDTTVRLRGQIQPTTGNFGSMTGGITVATLPTGFTPSVYQFVSFTGSNSSVENCGRLDVTNDGSLKLFTWSSSWTPSWICIDNATYFLS
jgi:hypothetical protein